MGGEATGARLSVPLLHGRTGIRTLDLHSAIVALSQLSYAPVQIKCIVAL